MHTRRTFRFSLSSQGKLSNATILFRFSLNQAMILANTNETIMQHHSVYVLLSIQQSIYIYHIHTSCYVHGHLSQSLYLVQNNVEFILVFHNPSILIE